MVYSKARSVSNGGLLLDIFQYIIDSLFISTSEERNENKFSFRPSDVETKSQYPLFSMEKTLKEEAREMLRVLVISLIIVLPIRFFVAQPFIVRGASMEPSFEDGEYLVVDELSYRFSPPGRGETIIFRYPFDPRQFFIKRIIALPGETVIIRDGNIRIIRSESNREELLLENYLPKGVETGPDIRVTLKVNEYFVLGDNRSNSSDSRVWGPLRKEYVVGKAFLRLWPPSRLGVL